MKKIFAFIIIFIAFSSFFMISKYNYDIHLKVMQNKVNHPEFIPKKGFSINTSFGFRNLKADFYWLKSIIYIGSNAGSSEYKKYLYSMIDLVTDLNPKFESPYKIGQLLIPSYKTVLKGEEKEKNMIHVDEAIKLSKKGIENFCDMGLVNEILIEDDLNKVWNNEKYKKSCESFDIPYYLGYIYYYYKQDGENASQYYKLASAQEGALEGAKTLTAIMKGKSGDRIKSVIMFLELSKSVNEDIEGCHSIGGVISSYIVSGGTVSEDFVKKVNEDVKNFLPFGEKNKINDENCSLYVNKAVRELNLGYLDAVNNSIGKKAEDAQDLFDKGYIKYLPVDFQQYEDHGMKYYFNDETGRFDYELAY